MKYVAYTRVSTTKQQDSGLGLEAQLATIKSFIKPEDELIFTFTEAESGTKCNRPELKKALQACKELKATLIVSRIDRLARNAKFLFTIRDSGVPILFCDFPQADNLVVGIMAVIAEWEAGRIRVRIKDALSAKKRRGEPMGNVANLHGSAKGGIAKHNLFLERLAPYKPLILHFLKEGKTPGEIVKKIPELFPKDKINDAFLYRAIRYVKSETQTLFSTINQ